MTAAQFVPTMFIRMLRLPDDVRAAADVSSLTLAIHAAAPCPVDVKRAMLDWWGPVIHEYYSGTEGSGLTWVTPEQWLAKPGTVGKAIVGVPHIVGPDGEELPVGQDGAVYFSDGPVFEYHNDREKTAATTSAQGWQTFGDIGHLDEDGFLYLTDRASYMIISGGVNVYPQETEDVLLSHPAVLDAAVFGIPHAEMGEVVHAVVQPVTMPADEQAAAALEAELVAHCATRLASIKRPRTIELRAELPRDRDRQAAQATAQGRVRGRRSAVTLLVAPDAFKGTFAAAEVAEAIAAGIEAAGGQADRCPVGRRRRRDDGGAAGRAGRRADRGRRARPAGAGDPRVVRAAGRRHDRDRRDRRGVGPWPGRRRRSATPRPRRRPAPAS